MWGLFESAFWFAVKTTISDYHPVMSRSLAHYAISVYLMFSSMIDISFDFNRTNLKMFL